MSRLSSSRFAIRRIRNRHPEHIRARHPARIHARLAATGVLIAIAIGTMSILTPQHTSVLKSEVVCYGGELYNDECAAANQPAEQNAPAQEEDALQKLKGLGYQTAEQRMAEPQVNQASANVPTATMSKSEACQMDVDNAPYLPEESIKAIQTAIGASATGTWVNSDLDAFNAACKSSGDSKPSNGSSAGASGASGGNAQKLALVCAALKIINKNDTTCANLSAKAGGTSGGGAQTKDAATTKQEMLNQNESDAWDAALKNSKPFSLSDVPEGSPFSVGASQVMEQNLRGF